jgi:hypothetical protein
VLAVLCLAALLEAGGAAPAAGEGRNRALERVVGEVFTPDEGAQLDRALRAAVKAGLREREALDLVETCVDGEFTAPQVLRVLSLAAQLTLEDLPVEAFAAKLEEGIAKRVESERVLRVAEKRALALNNARLVINGAVLDGFEVDDREALYADVAEALEAGRSADEVRRVLIDSQAEGEGIGGIRRKLFP